MQFNYTDGPMSLHNIPGVNQEYLPKTNAIRIVEFIAVPSDVPYKDVYQRTYSINGSAGSIDAISNLFNQSSVNLYGKINDITMARAASEVIGLSNRATGIAEIPYGWNQRRLQFMMVVEVTNGDITNLSYIQGYSEYHDPTLNGRPDPNMRFFINSVTDVQRRIDPISGAITSIPRQTYNVITDQYGGKKYEEIDTANTLGLVRPVDVIDGIAITDRYSQLGVNTIKDMSTTLGLGNAQASSKINNDPISYFTTTVNNFITGQAVCQQFNDYSSVLSAASGISKEPVLVCNPLVFAIHAITGETTPTSFTLNILDRIDPNAHLHIGEDHYDVFANVGTGGFMTAHDTAEMYQTDNITVKALTIVQMLNTYMTESLMGKMGVSFTNTSGQTYVEFGDYESFIPDLHPAYVERYMRGIYEKIVNILMPKVTDNNQTLIEVNVHSDITVDTTIQISVNNSPAVIFRLPTFADSLYAPVVSTADDKIILTNDFQAVFDATYNAVSHGTMY